MKRIMVKVGKMMCSVGLHRWYTRGTGKKNGKDVLIQKCSRCGKDRQRTR